MQCAKVTAEECIMCQTEVWRRGKSTKRKSDITWKTVDLNKMERTGAGIDMQRTVIDDQIRYHSYLGICMSILIYYKLATEVNKRILKLLIVCKEKSIFNQDTK